MVERAYFVSDLHLRGPDDANQRMFLDFVERRVRPSGARLVIGGDLFDFWYGMPGRVPAPFREVVDTLESLSDVVWVEGNHDVRLKRALGPQSTIHLETRRWTGRIGGLSVCLEHGDHVDPADVGHMAFKRFMLSRPAGLVARVLGERVLQWVGGTAAVISRGDADSVLGQDPRWLEAARRFAAARTLDGFDLTVLGHGHWLGWWPEPLVCLGDWLVFHSFLTVDEDGARLWRYVPDGDVLLADSAVGVVPPP